MGLLTAITIQILCKGRNICMFTTFAGRLFDYVRNLIHFLLFYREVKAQNFKASFIVGCRKIASQKKGIKTMTSF